MKLYLAGIKSYQLDLGIECSAFSDLRLERTIQGIKRDHNEPEPESEHHLPALFYYASSPAIHIVAATRIQ